MFTSKKYLLMLAIITLTANVVRAAASSGKENRPQLNGGAGRSVKITSEDMALSQAAFYGRVQPVKDNLAKGANPNMPVGTHTIFQEAFEYAFLTDPKTSRIIGSKPNYIDVLKELAQHGGNIQDLHLNDYYAHYFDKAGNPNKELFSSEGVGAKFKEILDYLKKLESKPRPQL